MLFAAPFVVHLPSDVATGLRSSSGGSRPHGRRWAAALVVAAIGFSSLRAGQCGRRHWPPLLGTIVLQALTFVVYLLAGPFVDDVPPTIRLLVLLAAQGGLIWLFAAWRGRTDGSDAGPLVAEILICSGALLLSLVLGIGGPLSGCWLILCVAGGSSVASGKAQVDGGRSGSTPTA